MLLDFGHAREKVINLLRKASITHTQLFQPFNAAVNYRNLACDVSKATIKCVELLFHVLELLHHFRLDVGNLLLRIVRTASASAGTTTTFLSTAA